MAAFQEKPESCLKSGYSPVTSSVLNIKKACRIFLNGMKLLWQLIYFSFLQIIPAFSSEIKVEN